MAMARVVMRFFPRLKNSGTDLPFMPKACKVKSILNSRPRKANSGAPSLAMRTSVKPFGFADADGENRRGDGGAIERFHFAVGDAVAENDDAGARGAVARGALQQLDQTGARILGAQPLQTARRDRLQPGAEANHAQIVITVEPLDQRLWAGFELLFDEVEAALCRLCLRPRF